jgi:SAM-dependent methyltransferase
MAAPSDPVEIFDRARRRRRRDRAQPRFADHAFVHAYIVEGLLDRLDSVKRAFTRVLDLGAADGSFGAVLRARGLHVVSADAGFAFARATRGVQCDEDRLPFADASFDLIVAAGGLDTVNDLPGALALIRRALVPDGLFLAGFAGAGSLPRLRDALLAADMAAGGGAAPRLHPQIDVRAAGDLLTRAGFALPVADSETLSVRYGDPLRLIADLRGMAGTNILRDTPPPLSRAHIAALLAAFAEGADADGRVTERIEVVYLTGWAPAPDQPKPARRGSGTHSLAEALRPRGPSRL